LIAAVIARLVAEVPALGSRVQGAADLAVLMKRGGIPTITPAAYILPLGMMGGDEDAMTGSYRQDVDRQISVALCLTSRDRAGAVALDEADQLIDAITTALCGWAPDDDMVGVFRLLRAILARFQDGVAIYELQFAIKDQLRISA
tara:strand:- start:8141 stop:8575 length:435 start_codon:yes stop_codon:yes gene_type:complete